jgi:hypothetical protein
MVSPLKSRAAVVVLMFSVAIAAGCGPNHAVKVKTAAAPEKFRINPKALHVYPTQLPSTRCESIPDTPLLKCQDLVTTADSVEVAK